MRLQLGVGDGEEGRGDAGVVSRVPAGRPSCVTLGSLGPVLRGSRP